MAELESALAAWFKYLHQSDASTDGTYLKEKILHIAACLGISKFLASNGEINRFKTRHNTVYRTLSETAEDWKNG